jgi:hypothetical protein
MATDDGTGDTLSASERRLVELLDVLGAEVVAGGGDLPVGVVRRLRGQRDARIVLTVGSGVLSAVAAGVLGVFPRVVAGGERR